MASGKKFEDLEAWKLAREISRLIYWVSSNGAFAKDFALTSRMISGLIKYSKQSELKGSKFN